MDEAINADTEGLDEAAQRQARRGRRMAHRVAHRQDWANVILQEFREVVDSGLQGTPADRPVVGGTKWPPED